MSVPPRPVMIAVDDDPMMLRILEIRVAAWDWEVRPAAGPAELRAALAKGEPDLLLMDLQLREGDSVGLVEEIHRSRPDLPILVVTGHASIDAAVRCIKAGAFDFLTKPLDFERLRREMDKVAELGRLRRRVHDLESGRAAAAAAGMIGAGPALQQVCRTIEAVAPTDATVLVLGETGTGKELAARALHRLSRRATGPFVAVNAAAIPHELIESALFGHERGSFTGAGTHVGFCEQADRGTLFLDEIAEMDYRVQAKLLRFLQDRIVQPVGARTGRPVDVRVVAATNVEAEQLLLRRRLREDLFYRLNVVTLRMPPLRERREDIPALVGHFLAAAARRHSRPMAKVQPDAMARLQARLWPGNIRELENFIERVVVTNPGETLTAEMVPPERLPALPPSGQRVPGFDPRGDAGGAPRRPAAAEDEGRPAFDSVPSAGGWDGSYGRPAATDQHAAAPLSGSVPAGNGGQAAARGGSSSSWDGWPAAGSGRAVVPDRGQAGVLSRPEPTALGEDEPDSRRYGMTPVPRPGSGEFPGAAPGIPQVSLEEMEKRMISEALNQEGGSVPAASRRLGISEATVYRKIKKFGLRRRAGEE